jgi:hypothetical protein
VGGFSLLDPSMFVYYKTALTQNPSYRAFHEFIHKPIIEFDSVKLFMGKASFMLSLLKFMYEDETLDVRFVWGSPELPLFPTLIKASDVFFPGISTADFYTVPADL